jgi:site-specific recombinase XerD
METDTISTAAGHITPSTPLLPAIKSWEYYLSDQGRSIHTVKAFIADLGLLAAYMPPDRNLGAITTQDLNHFLQWLQTRRGVPCSPKSLARRITSLKAFFRWLHQSGVLMIDPAEKVLQQSVISPLPVVLTEEEVEMVMSTAMQVRHEKKPDPRPYVLLALLLTTGIKKGECLTIYHNHLDLESPNGPLLFIRYANARSRYKERRISLTSDWVAAYQEYIAQYPPEERVFPWSQRRLEYILEDIGKAAGLTKHLSFDMCRWTCALKDWQAHVEADKIRQKLGVSKIQWREVGLKLRQLSGEK